MSSASARGGRGPLSAVDGTMPEWAARADANPALAFLDSCLRGVGQVVFMNNPVTGLLILVALFVASAWLAVAGLIGLVVSTLTAVGLGLDRGAIRNGLYGFNGILVGLAFSLFLTPAWDVVVILWIVAVSAASTVLMATLAAVTLPVWKVPPFTLPFNFATLLFLVAGLGLAHGQLGPLVEPASPAAAGGEVSTTLRAVEGGESANDLEGYANAILRGVGQLFFANDVVSGIIIIVAIVVASRIAAGFALIGSTVGMLTGLALGANGVAIYNGLWGFNSFDAALAVGGVFFVLSATSAVFAVGCAAFTALLFGALVALLAPWGLPALTLPFCFGTLAFVTMKYTTSRLVPVEVEDITTPEEHLRRHRAESSPGPGHDAIAAARPGPEPAP